jgi:NAD+ synthetase
MNAFDSQKTVDRLTDFLRNTFAASGFATAVIGVSGGVDSATSLALTVRALGAEHVIPVLLPYGALSTQGVLDAMEQITALSIAPNRIVRIDIQPAVDALARLTMPDQLRRGNMMARMRMVALFDQAKKHRAMVVGTENRTEHLLGYYTRFGDEASDIEPLRGLYKTQVYGVARQLGVTQAILTKAPSAGLWPQQTDEGEFGFTYAQADAVFEWLYDQHKTLDEGPEGIDKATAGRVGAFAERNAFKDRLPYVAVV